MGSIEQSETLRIKCRKISEKILKAEIYQDNRKASTCNISLEVARPATVTLGRLPTRIEVDTVVQWCRITDYRFGCSQYLTACNKTFKERKDVRSRDSASP